MDSKTVTKFRARIKKANNSFSAMSSMMLVIELQGMNQDDRVTLRDSLLNGRNPIEFEELNKLIENNK